MPCCCTSNSPGRSKVPIPFVQLAYEGVSDLGKRAAGPEKRLGPGGGAQG